MTNQPGLPIAARLAAPFFALLLGACASGLEVRSDQDPNVDFSQYRTWNFFEQLGIEGGYNSPVFGEHFRDAITEAMKFRGYRQSGDPDLYINVTLRADDVLSDEARGQLLTLIGQCLLGLASEDEG